MIHIAVVHRKGGVQCEDHVLESQNWLLSMYCQEEAQEQADHIEQGTTDSPRSGLGLLETTLLLALGFTGLPKFLSELLVNGVKMYVIIIGIVRNVRVIVWLLV